MGSKNCFRCNETKPLSEFYKHKEMADGYLNKCKGCAKLDTKSNYRANKSHYIEYEQQRQQNPERRSRNGEYQRRRRAKDPAKERTRRLTTYAIRTGKLVKQKCEKCGVEETEAHHTDYSKPYDVMCLCRPCHMAEHNKIAYELHNKGDL